MTLRALIAATALCSASAASAHRPAAPHEYPCFWVHGRYGVYLGSGIRRIWIIGTHRIVHMWDDDPTPAPKAIKDYQ